MIRRPPRSTLSSSSAASDVYKRQGHSCRGRSLPNQQHWWGTLFLNDQDRRGLSCIGRVPEEDFQGEARDCDEVVPSDRRGRHQPSASPAPRRVLIIAADAAGLQVLQACGRNASSHPRQVPGPDRLDCLQSLRSSAPQGIHGDNDFLSNAPVLYKLRFPPESVSPRLL